VRPGSSLAAAFLALAALLSTAGPAGGAAGDFDPTFSGDGKLTFPIVPGTSFDIVNAAVLQGDGRIVLAGQADSKLAIGRLNPDGTLDRSFSGDGIETTSVPGSSSSEAAAVALQPDGKVVVAGSAVFPATGSDVAVLRYLPGGSLDDSFDDDGIRTDAVAPGTNTDSARGVALSGTRIVVAGFANMGATGEDFALARYASGGTPDSSFNTTGFRTDAIAPGGGSDRAAAVAVQPDSLIVAAGRSAMGGITGRDFSVARYTDSGAPDDDFGTNGFQTVPIAPGSGDSPGLPGEDTAFDLALQPNGNIVMAGQSHMGTSTTEDFSLARLTPVGELDGSFDDDGKLTIPLTPGAFNDLGRAVAVQPDGRIVVAGHTDTATERQFALARVGATGSLDPTFAGNGIKAFSMGFGFANIGDVIIQPDGRIVAAGAAEGPAGNNIDWAVARLNGDMADLSVTLAGAPDRIGPRNPVSYTLTAHNAGPEAAVGVTASYTVPPGAQLRTAAPSRGSCSGGPAISCALGDIPAGGDATVVVTVVPTVRGTSTQAAGVAAFRPLDPNPANNSASASTTVANPAARAFRFSPTTFREGFGLPVLTQRRRVRTGATIRFNLSQAARVRLTFARPRPGRRVGRRCRRPTRRNRGRRRCTRFVPVRSAVSVTATPGLNRLRFQGRISRRRKLRPGRYRATLVATDPAGNRSRPVRTRFRMLPRARRR
jgi:uncharacterized delta-60 repeat protein